MAPEEARGAHSSIAGLVGEMIAKPSDVGEENDQFAKCLENVHLLRGSRGTICVFKRCCVGCEIWARTDLNQLSRPFSPLSAVSRLSPALLDSINARVSTATSGEDADNSLCSVSF